MNWEALRLSVELALLTSVFLLLLGIPLAHWIVLSKWRWKFLVEAVVALPIVLPPTVLGFYLLVAFGQNSPLGAFYESIAGTTLPFTFGGLLVASILYSLPFAVQPLATAFAGVNPRLVQSSWVLGESRWRTFLRIVLPLSKSGIITAFVLSFAHTLGEFGVVLMVGGNIPGVTRTLSIDLYDQVQALHYRSAGETALFLLILSFFFLSIVTYMNRKRQGAEGGTER
ncbi:MAG: molybdate ABC transporter permease subunit [Candidatus Manganitrophus sp. SA1]|nr:molybdate ABC transporter permease subunit [Candidatus Manganitrophus morganii]